MKTSRYCWHAVRTQGNRKKPVYELSCELVFAVNAGRTSRWVHAWRSGTAISRPCTVHFNSLANACNMAVKHVACVWPPCCTMLRSIGQPCWTCCNMIQQCCTQQHVAFLWPGFRQLSDVCYRCSRHMTRAVSVLFSKFLHFTYKSWIPCGAYVIMIIGVVLNRWSFSLRSRSHYRRSSWDACKSTGTKSSPTEKSRLAQRYALLRNDSQSSPVK